MPKLQASQQAAVDSAEDLTGFKPLEPGKYVARLSKVDGKQTSTGVPMWAIEFDEVHTLDGEKQPGRQFTNLQFPPAGDKPESYGKSQEKWDQYVALSNSRVKQFFAAFGYTTDSDTDEMIGERCVLTIGQRTINGGPRVGQLGNEINGMEPLDKVPGATDVATGSTTKASADDF